MRNSLRVERAWDALAAWLDVASADELRSVADGRASPTLARAEREALPPQVVRECAATALQRSIARGFAA